MRLALKWAVGAVVVIGLTLAVLLLVLDSHMLRRAVAEVVSAATGREVLIDGRLWASPALRPRISARDVRVANAEWASAPNMVEIEYLEMQFDLLALARGRLLVPYLRVRGASTFLEVDPQGRVNWELGTGPEPSRWQPQVQSLVIEDSRLGLHDRQRDLVLDAAITSSEAADADGRARVVTVEGAGRFQGQALELAMRGGSFLALQGQDGPYPLEVEIRVGESEARLAGTVREPLEPGDLEMRLHITGPNAALLAPILQVPVPGTRPYELSGDLVREANVWQFRNFSGTVGDSDLAGTISVDVGRDRPRVIADLVAEHVDSADLGPVIGLQTEAFVPDGSGGASPQRILSDEPLQREQIQRTDAQLKFSGKRVVAPRLPLLQDVELDLELEDGVLRISPLRFGFKGGAVTLLTSIYSRVEPAHTDLDLRVSGIQLQNVLDAMGIEGSAEGAVQGRAVISVDGDTLRAAMATAKGQASLFQERGRISGSALALLDAGFLEALALSLGDREPDPMVIRCLVAGFDIDDGVMTATTAVLDTEDTLITSRGSIDLGDETLMLHFQGEPKHPGIGHTRLGVVISGPFTSPSAEVDPSRVMLRGGLALGLGALFAPLAAILPFIDLGLAEDSECLQLMGEGQ